VPREHPLSLHRVVPVLVVGLLCLVALLWWRGPVWFQRLYHPLGYESDIARAAKANDIDPYLVAAVINVESGYSPDEISSRGAIGLMQLMPATAREVARERAIPAEVDTEGLKAPKTNITIGTAYLAALMTRYDGNLASALGAYNGGLSNGDRWHTAGSSTAEVSKRIDFPETRTYVANVLKERETYRKLYPGVFEGIAK
jgi:soluble lytic murein transglycosylase